MQTFDELYSRLLKSAASGKPSLLTERTQGADWDRLIHPERHAPIWHTGKCDCSGDTESPCTSSCIYDAIGKDEKGNVIIDEKLCVGCAACVHACKSGKLTGSKDILPVLDAVKNAKSPVYAMVAPAFAGQFGKEVTPGMLRCALKKVGFTEMTEVALFADILTLREALLFDQNIQSMDDYMITSCCCPIWVAMIRRVYSQFMSHMPDSVSPMVAAGRTIKALEPDAVTVFIGPCIAKKVEARERDISGAVDYVLTFEEVKDIFDAFQVDMAAIEDDPAEQASKSGRIYGRTGGVSDAVLETVKKLNPYRPIALKAWQADGVPSCKELLNRLQNGLITANFLEGMGCEGGCVGGPKTLIGREEGREHINRYGDVAQMNTPLDNPKVLELLRRLGFESVESLLHDSRLFTRQFEEYVKT